MPRDWDGSAYHRLSGPQFGWGKAIVEGLVLHGDERVLDVGCGSGRLTELLLERLPEGSIVGVDPTPSMVAKAREHLARFGDRIEVREMSVLDLGDENAFDLVFSTATFHWIHDHARLFRVLFTALRPGGRLVAQCGGGANVAHVHALAKERVAHPDFAPFFRDFEEPWFFADVASTYAHLLESGFAAIDVYLTEAPAAFPDRASYREFGETVVLGSFVQRISDPALRARFMDEIADEAGRADPPYVFDYVRLNIAAKKPDSR
jgi:trans-aconitate methyltransferase